MFEETINKTQPEGLASISPNKITMTWGFMYVCNHKEAGERVPLHAAACEQGPISWKTPWQGRGTSPDEGRNADNLPGTLRIRILIFRNYTIYIYTILHIEINIHIIYT